MHTNIAHSIVMRCGVDSLTRRRRRERSGRLDAVISRVARASGSRPGQMFSSSGWRAIAMQRTPTRCCCWHTSYTRNTQRKCVCLGGLRVCVCAALMVNGCGCAQSARTLTAVVRQVLSNVCRTVDDGVGCRATNAYAGAHRGAYGQKLCGGGTHAKSVSRCGRSSVWRAMPIK